MSGTDDRTFTFETGLERLRDISQLPALRKEKTRMNSSGGFYPYAKDGATFLYRDSNGEYVLFDSTGSGCLVRYWSAMVKEGTVIRFYFDGHREPDIEMPLADMFSGNVYPWVQPIVGHPELSSGGNYSYVPMPYALGCKVTLDRIPSFYHLESINLPDYATVETFDPANAERWRASVSETVDTLNATACPELGTEPQTVELGPGESVALVDCEGCGVVDAFTVQLESYEPEIMRQLLLRGWWDDAKLPSVWSPLGDFFVNGHEKVNFRAQVMGSTDDGFFCRFPMPFQKKGRLEIVNEGEKPVKLVYAVAVRKLEALPEDWALFHARWTRMETQIDEYVPLLTTLGRGKFVGLAYNCQAISPWMLEGDEVVWADGELMPSIHGTGTEDYFNGAWYFDRGPFDLPMHGAPLLELHPTGQLTRVSLYRFHTLDPFSFEERMRCAIEHGQELSMQGSDYCYTSYWYQESPDKTGFPMPGASARLPETCDVVKLVEAYAPFDEAVKAGDDATAADLGLKLLDRFPNAATHNSICCSTGRALLRLGRTDEAVRVWNRRKDYYGVDLHETKICAAEAWAHGGQSEPPPKALLEVKRLNEGQTPGKFDETLWAGLPVATEFHPNFPHSAYYDLPADLQVKAQVAYDDANVYLRAWCEEPDTDALVVSDDAGSKLDLGQDAFIIATDPERTYAQSCVVVTDVKGRVRGGAPENAMAFWRGAAEIEPVADAAADVVCVEDGWTLELAVPRAALGLEGDISGKVSGLLLLRIRKAGLEDHELTMWGEGISPWGLSEFAFARFE